MSKHWSEPLDPARHRNYMTRWHGGLRQQPTADPAFDDRRAYFVRVVGFTFEFVSLDDIRECSNWFRQDHHPSSRLPDVVEHDVGQSWHERLPKGLNKAGKREKIIVALERALVDFESGNE